MSTQRNLQGLSRRLVKNAKNMQNIPSVIKRFHKSNNSLHNSKRHNEWKKIKAITDRDSGNGFTDSMDHRRGNTLTRIFNEKTHTQ